MELAGIESAAHSFWYGDQATIILIDKNILFILKNSIHLRLPLCMCQMNQQFSLLRASTGHPSHTTASDSLSRSRKQHGNYQPEVRKFFREDSEKVAQANMIKGYGMTKEELHEQRNPLFRFFYSFFDWVMPFSYWIRLRIQLKDEAHNHKRIQSIKLPYLTSLLEKEDTLKLKTEAAKRHTYRKKSQGLRRGQNRVNQGCFLPS